MFQGIAQRTFLPWGWRVRGEKSPPSVWVIKFEFLVGFSQRQPFEQRVEREFQQW